MTELKSWMGSQFDNKLVEPNSSHGKAFSYLFNHWDKLTQFLKVMGAPLHSNIVEQAHKRAIVNRKNSYFFKTEYGAMVSDLFMSVIETCRETGVDPFKYLIALQEHSSKLQQKPEAWLPWNYHHNLIMRTEAA